ncbi:MAG: ABC transporter ATP-binding protein/permease, partial [Actinomycetota bacterium]|nr:ABC transporter ATP-binding protein/permease [Actinomycetota bacterium]
ASDDPGRQPAPGITIYDVCGPPQEPPRLRRLPRVVGAALGMVWAAGRRHLVGAAALKALNGAGVAVLVLGGGDLLAGVLTADRTGAAFSAVGPELVALIAVTAVMGFLAAVGQQLQDVLGELTARHAQERIVEVTCAVELEAFETPAFHDRLQRAALGGQRRPLQTVHGLLGLAGGGLGATGTLVALAALEPLLVPLALTGAVPLWVAAAKSGQVFFRFAYELTPADRRRQYLYGLLTGKEAAKEIRAFNLTGLLRERHRLLYDERIAELRRTARRRMRLSLLGSLGMSAVLGAAVGGLVFMALSGRITLAEAGAATAAVLVLGERLMGSAMSAGQLYEAAPFIEDFLSFLELAPAAKSRPPTGPAPRGFSRLLVDGVSFTYPSGDRPALQDVSLEIRAGEVVALVGENGSGKTTLAKLLARLYLPQSGRLLWDGVDAATVDPDELRRSVALIFQDFARYTLPARDNIGLGRPEHIGDLAAIVAAAAQAGADSFLARLPDGYDTILGPEFEGGTDLSVGQWQRVALARAFFRDAPFVILDEPTAALDARAEHELFEHIRSLLRGRTVLLISHRFSSVRCADRIYVLKAGAVVEHGTHEELMARGGLYAELFGLQAAAYLESDGGSIIPPGARQTPSSA